MMNQSMMVIYPLSIFQLISLASLFSGLTLALLLWLLPGHKQTNRLMGLILLASGLQQVSGYVGCSVLLGPLMYHYVQNRVNPDWRWRWYDGLHLATGLLTFFLKDWIVPSIIIFYLYGSWRLIRPAARIFQPGQMDRPLHAFRSLERSLMLLMTLGLLWLFNDVFSMCFAAVLIVLAAQSVLKAAFVEQVTAAVGTPPALRVRGRWLKRAVKDARLYEDPELTVTSMAERLAIQPHELSRTLNLGLKKSFADFISELRIAEVIRKMQDPAYDRITLLGIAYDSGFNSKTSFHRIFKEMTGKSPAVYQKELKKEVPFSKLGPSAATWPVISYQVTRNHMFKNYLKIAWRNTTRNKASSLINICGLAVGMAVAMLIGLWIWDEVSFNKFNANYDRIVQVLANKHVSGGIATQASQPFPLTAVLREQYGSDFKAVAAAVTYEQNINYHNHAFSRTGCFAEPAMTDIITLHMVKGSKTAFKTPGTILINASLARAVFGDTDPINKMIKISDAYLVQVGGVYQDLPQNTQFGNVEFIAPIRLLFNSTGDMNNWYDSSFQVFALLNQGIQLPQTTHKIQHILNERRKDATKPELVLFPMRAWHIYEFKDGIAVAGRLQFIWLFGIIGLFVLLLACINFMNLSTARSEKRAKEVGIRKAIGSLRGQLVTQFLSESFLIVAISFLLAVLLAWLSLPFFNDISGKQLHLIWNDPLVWLICLCFCLLTGLTAGSYPALYLSSFNAVKVLKGTFKAGPMAAMPRKVLVVLQFAVSVTIIIGTIVVFKQIEFAKDRPVGYSRDKLVSIPYNAIKEYSAFRQELLNTGAVSGVSPSSNPTTGTWSSADNLSWRGKDPNRQEVFGTVLVDPDFGSVVGWKMKEGRDFSSQFRSDSSGFLFNEAAIRQMGLKQPVGETIKWHGKDWKVLGVVKDMVMNSPFEPVSPVVFLMDDHQRSFNVVILKLKAGQPVARELASIEAVFKKFAPEAPFNYKFADSEYEQKFLAEERTGKLASVFAVLAIFISCLGLFGVASFVAEQRIKEIGIRKVLGASVISIWGSLSKEFMLLVGIALLIAVPCSWYFMHQWLQHYTYRTGLSWWVFALTAAGALLITLITVSYHSIKAALTNPVKSLRAE
ncbi:ABC transporter permease [Mucilaginibacter kameinonensis]|uniref:ABC transporter permease n=1 Tax=Mucilaginibacter kameinonensis TaxID=452286 RepID=UPI0013CF031C|nr:FtsX-like permease family protein [Mucilaginibacter kameinonensis]